MSAAMTIPVPRELLERLAQHAACWGGALHGWKSPNESAVVADAQAARALLAAPQGGVGIFYEGGCPACAGTGYSPNSDVWIPHPCGKCHGGGKFKTKQTTAPPEK